MLCKLDIEKSYDQVNWNCIIKVLHKWGFGLSGLTGLMVA